MEKKITQTKTEKSEVPNSKRNGCGIMFEVDGTNPYELQEEKCLIRMSIRNG